MSNTGFPGKKYTHIFFDLDNTLWDFETNSQLAMTETFRHFKLGSFVEFNDFFDAYERHNHHLWDLYRKNEVIKKDLVRMRFQLTFDDLNISGVDPVEMNEAYLAAMPLQRELNDGALELLQYLKSSNYRLFIITNGFSEVQYKKIENTGLKSFFEKIFISEEIKTPKPGRDIFAHSVKSANARKSNSIMIGDDLETDVLGANRFGLDAIHFLNDPQVAFRQINTKSIAKTNLFEAGTLRQLLAFF